jgi:hypothetical protein
LVQQGQLGVRLARVVVEVRRGWGGCLRPNGHQGNQCVTPRLDSIPDKTKFDPYLGYVLRTVVLRQSLAPSSSAVVSLLLRKISLGDNQTSTVEVALDRT